MRPGKQGGLDLLLLDPSCVYKKKINKEKYVIKLIF